MSTKHIRKEVEGMAKVIEVICVHAERGRGAEDDPSREVTQLWTKDGQLICELDPSVEPELPELR